MALQVLDRVVGWDTDLAVQERLHCLRHRQAVEYIHLAAGDLDRRRLRVTSDAGTDYAVVLARTAVLADGAVLLLEPDRAVVVRAVAPQTLTLRPTDLAAALRLGYLAGHLHWKIDQREEALVVHLEAPPEDYLARIRDLMDGRRVQCE